MYMAYLPSINKDIGMTDVLEPYCCDDQTKLYVCREDYFLFPSCTTCRENSLMAIRKENYVMVAHIFFRLKSVHNAFFQEITMNL